MDEKKSNGPKESVTKPKTNVAESKVRSESTGKPSKGGSKMNQKKDTTKEVAAKNNGHSNGKREIRLSDMPVVKLTKKAFGELDGAGLVERMIDPANEAINRISRERALELLTTRIKAGKIKITGAALMDLTFKRVVVEGVDPEALKDVRGVATENAKVTLTQDEFNALTPEQTAAYVEQYTHKRSAANKYVPAYIGAGMPMTAEDVVWLTCGRVAIAGVTVETKGKKSEAVTDGVKFD